MSKRKASTPKESELFPTDNLDLVNYLLMNKIEPIKRTTDNGTASLFYIRSKKLDKLLLTFMTPCETCGIQFSGVGPARAKARRLLLEGLPK